MALTPTQAEAADELLAIARNTLIEEMLAEVEAMGGTAVIFTTDVNFDEIDEETTDEDLSLSVHDLLANFILSFAVNTDEEEDEEVS